MNVKALHGDMSQGSRDGVMLSFKGGRVPILVATDVAARGLDISTVTHVVTFGLFVWFGQLVHLGWLWWIGLALTAAAFVYQHVVIKPDDLSKVNRAFFTANGFVGIALFLFALLDLILADAFAVVTMSFP